MKENPIIVALDGMSYDDMIALATVLRGNAILKVNDALTAYGVSLVRDLMECGSYVMVDQKWYDIPNTMANTARRFLCSPDDPLRRAARVAAMKSSVAPPPWAVTVHASAGQKGIAAVANVFKGTSTKVLAVTVLTSMDEDECLEVYNRRTPDEVRVLARVAFHAGAHGFVCSPEEAGVIRAMFPTTTIVTPGIRSPGVAQHDQHRISTPAKAIEAGADYLVMGRQIIQATSPLIELRRVLEEELASINV